MALVWRSWGSLQTTQLSAGHSDVRRFVTGCSACYESALVLTATRRDGAVAGMRWHFGSRGIIGRVVVQSYDGISSTSCCQPNSP
jgi:hypothetical protein